MELLRKLKGYGNPVEIPPQTLSTCSALGNVMFTHSKLLDGFRKGLRNRNWRKLSRLEKALVRASMWYSRAHGAIVNETLVGKLSLLMERLTETKGVKILKRGFEKAAALLSKGESVFAWAPSLRVWLNDPDYVFWLGTGGLRIVTA